MINKVKIVFSLLVVLLTACTPKKNSVETNKSSIDVKIDSLLAKMTLREKIGQMTQINLTVIAKGSNKWSSNDTMEIDPVKAKKAIMDYKVGSVLNTVNNLAQTPKTWYENISEIQKFAIDSTPIKIPIIYGIDAIHGVTPMEPQCFHSKLRLQPHGIQKTLTIWVLFVLMKQEHLEFHGTFLQF
jgi:hypothetical protein